MAITKERHGELCRIYRAQYHDFIETIKRDHIEGRAAGGAHDFYHAAITAQIGVLIADEECMGRKVFLAGFCHNTDHLVQKNSVEYFVRSYLSICSDVSALETESIVSAVMSHGCPPSEADSDLLIVLRDADRVANSGVNVIMRAGQYYWDAQSFDPKWIEGNDPTTTAARPRTVWRDIRELYQWEKEIRMPVARELFARHMALIRMAEEDLLLSLKESGMYPCPPEYYVPAPEPSGKHP